MDANMDINDIFSETWQVFKENFVAYIVGTLITALGSIFIVTIAPLMYGLTYMAVKGVRGEKVEINDVFEGFNHFINSWVFVLVAGILLFIGYLLLVIPGIILSILLLYAFPLMVLKGYGGIDAIQGSIGLSKENFVDTLILSVILWVINAIGGSLYLGSLITVPIALIAAVVATNALGKEEYTYVADYEDISDTDAGTDAEEGSEGTEGASEESESNDDESEWE
ncbi:MAG: glycerophosphodiester phosphodiesterase [Euryarchaeota archaeon]|nr:glycerophosphodiester phosphodiesterase [Euryarchaeota archaeon]